MSLIVVRIGLPRIAPKAHVPHQPGHRAASGVETFPPQLSPDLAYAIDAEVFLEYAPDLDADQRLGKPIRQSRGINAPGDMIVIGRRGNRQNPADRLALPAICYGRLDLPTDARAFTEALKAEMTETLAQLNKGMPQDSGVRLGPAAAPPNHRDPARSVVRTHEPRGAQGRARPALADDEPASGPEGSDIRRCSCLGLVFLGMTNAPARRMDLAPDAALGKSSQQDPTSVMIR